MIDRLAPMSDREAAGFLSVDSHVQSGSLFFFDRSNSLFSSLVIVQKVGNGTDTEYGRKDASSKSTVQGSCLTQ